jgi:hypothetical protein
MCSEILVENARFAQKHEIGTSNEFLQNQARSTAGVKWDQNSWQMQASKAMLQRVFFIASMRDGSKKNSLY